MGGQVVTFVGRERRPGRAPVRAFPLSQGDAQHKAQQMLAPRILSPDQRFVLHTLVEQEGDLRGRAIFALGYWAGCRVSDIAHLRMEHAHIGPRSAGSMLAS